MRADNGKARFVNEDDCDFHQEAVALFVILKRRQITTDI